MQIWDLLTKLAGKRFSSVMGVLVCDNNQSISLSLRSFFCKTDFSVTVAHQGMQREFQTHYMHSVQITSGSDLFTVGWLRDEWNVPAQLHNLFLIWMYALVICGWFLQKPHGEKQKLNYNVLSPPCSHFCMFLRYFCRMKLKEINRTAIQSWSPAQHHPIYLATGTSMQRAASTGLQLLTYLELWQPLYHLYCVYQPVIQPLRLMRVWEHTPPSSAVWTTGTRRPLLEKLLSYMMWHNMSGPLCLQEHQPSSWMPPSAPMPPWSFSSWTWLNRLWTWSHVAASPPLTGTESCSHVVVDCVSFECSCSPQTSPLSLHRYHKLVWGPYGMDSGAHPSGVLIAGGENGNVILYDPAKIMAGESDVIIAESEKHTGPVRALDVNPYQVWSS